MVVFILLAFFSCKKDETNTTSNPTHTNSMSGFNAAHKKPLQDFTLNASLGGSISTTGGMEFFFPANALVNSAGNTVSGNVNVQIDEVITKADLFFNQISTHADGRPLNSGGAFKIKVTQGSEELSMAVGQQYHVWLTSNSTEPTMETYHGIPTTDQFGIINWTTTPPGFSPNVFTNTTDSATIYEMVLDEFNWINCDHPYDSLFSELNITLPTGSENCQIMVMDNSSMTAVSLWGNSTTASWSYAPINKQLTVVVTCKTNEEYKLSVQTFYFTGQQITMPMLTTIGEADLEALILTYQ